jgi:mitogen-activated protein kinase 1/3
LDLGVPFIVQMIGLPNDSDLAFVKNENARRYLRQLPKYEKKPLQERYPNLSPLALDLVDKMLTFDATKRISG